MANKKISNEELESSFAALVDYEGLAIKGCKKILGDMTIESTLRVLDWLHSYYEDLAEELERHAMRKVIDPDGNEPWKKSLGDPPEDN